jgi:hypothetical protein
MLTRHWAAAQGADRGTPTWVEAGRNICSAAPIMPPTPTGGSKQIKRIVALQQEYDLLDNIT